MTTKLSKLDLHLRSRRHSLYFCVSLERKEKPQCPSTLHGHYTEVTQRVLYFSLLLYLFTPLPIAREKAKITGTNERGNACLSYLLRRWCSPLHCPWVLSISGKEARRSADCRGCYVKYFRHRPRREIPVYPSLVLCFRTTLCSPINRR